MINAYSKEIIIGNVQKAVNTLDGMMENSIISSSERLRSTIIFQEVLIILNIVFMGCVLLFTYIFLIKPVNKAVDALLRDKDVELKGVKEFRYLGVTYNNIREQNEEHQEELVYLAEHDKLTGLYNRAGYDAIFQNIQLNGCTFILIDVDKFKEVNDRYGHASGDKVLKQVSKLLNQSFNKEKEHVFRIGGDEFAIIIEEGGATVFDVVDRCNKINQNLTNNSKKENNISLSIGIAHGNALDTTDTLFRKADIAMYETKKNGRGNVTVYQEEE